MITTCVIKGVPDVRSSLEVYREVDQCKVVELPQIGHDKDSKLDLTRGLATRKAVHEGPCSVNSIFPRYMVLLKKLLTLMI